MTALELDISTYETLKILQTLFTSHFKTLCSTKPSSNCIKKLNA